MRRSAFIAILALLALLAACGGTATTTEPTPDATPTPAATATPEPDETDDGLGGLDLGDLDFNEAPELAATLPDSIGGQPVQAFSFRGDGILESGLVDDPSIAQFLDSVGASASDVAFAMAIGGDQASGEVVTIMAIQVTGAAGDELMQQFLGASEETGMAGWTSQPVGGKSVQTIAMPGMEAFGTFYAYVTGDTLYYVFGSQEHAEEAISQLP